MPSKNHPKDIKPGYRVQPGATNGPYAWGNGPQPKKKGIVAAIIDKLKGK